MGNKILSIAVNIRIFLLVYFCYDWSYENDFKFVSNQLFPL